MTQLDEWAKDYTDELGDLAYSKLENKLAAIGRALGWQSSSGIDLVEQAERMYARSVALDSAREEMGKLRERANERINDLKLELSDMVRERNIARAETAAAARVAEKWATELDEAREALTAALDWLENAPISYVNGNVHNGMDEGDVLGSRHHEKLVAQLREVLGIPICSLCNQPVREHQNFVDSEGHGLVHNSCLNQWFDDAPHRQGDEQCDERRGT